MPRASETAKTEFLTAARLNPEVAAIYNNLALVEDALGDSQAAAESLRRAIRLEPGLTEAHNNLGAVLFRRSLARVLGELVADGDATEADAAHLASLVARDNARRAYGL